MSKEFPLFTFAVINAQVWSGIFGIPDIDLPPTVAYKPLSESPKLKLKEFAGCAFAINELDEKEGSKELILDYNVVQPPENKSVEDASGPNFDAALNFIIQDILQKAIDVYENREGNPTEPSEWRCVYEKSDPVLKAGLLYWQQRKDSLW